MTPIEWSDEGRKELFAAYVKAQAEMGAVFKGAVNPAFKSKYADLATVIDAVAPAFNKNGMAIIQSPSFDGEVVTVETVIAHTSGGFLRSALSMRPTKADPQGVGSATTYARRYALLSLAGVAPEDDDGQAASAPGTAGQKFAAGQPMAAHTVAAQEASSGRKTAAQAKRDGDHERIKDQVQRIRNERDLDDWFMDFERGEATVLPYSWLDAIRDMVESRRNELLDQMAAA